MMLQTRTRTLLGFRKANVASFALSTRHVVTDPYRSQPFCEVPILSTKEALAKVALASRAQQVWQQCELSAKQALCRKWMNVLDQNGLRIANEITGQMGKPLTQSLNEIKGTIARAQTMIELSTDALREDVLLEESGNYRAVSHEPVGVVYIIAPWNYPLLTVVNALIPAVLAGNAIVLKHSPQTPLCGNHFESTFEQTGFPKNLVTSCFSSHDTAEKVMARREIGAVCFTGSVQGGHQVMQSLSNRLVNVNMELGGKDAAYVADDADIEAAAASLVDGACYNAGQSCCAIERIFVHETQYDRFLDKAASLVRGYKMGDPYAQSTTLGPMALLNAPSKLDVQVWDAIAKGATRVVGNGASHDASGQGRFYTPTLLKDCDSSMLVMREETFGPIVAVSAVESDHDAVVRINDCRFGLTACVFTGDKRRALEIGQQLQVGTVFMNRCDVLDPRLPWGGTKQSGKGVSLSKFGFQQFTRLKAVGSP